MDKALIKRLIILIVSLTIVVIAFLIPFDFNRAQAGGGMKGGEKIRSSEEAANLVKGFCGQLQDSMPVGGEITSPEIYSAYGSATVSETSDAKLNMEINGSSERSEMKLEYSRVLTIYTNDYSNYSVGELRLNSTKEKSAGRDNDKLYVFIKFQLYSEKSFGMLRFDDVRIIVNGEIRKTLNGAIGEWVYFSSEEAEEYLEILYSLSVINAFNPNVFYVAQNYLEDKTSFEKDGNILELRKEYSDGLLRDLTNTQFGGFEYYAEGSGSADFKIDFRNEKAPELKLSFNCATNRGDLGSVASAYYSGSSVDKIIFKDINNTVIKAPNVRKAMSYKEFKAMTEE